MSKYNLSMEEIDKHLAARGKRLLAYLIDILPIILLIFVIFYSFLGFDEILGNYLSRGDDIEPRIVFLKQRNWIRDISFVIWIAYGTVMEASSMQGTFGKNAMGIKVIDANGNRLSPIKSTARNLCKIISYIVILLGFVWILFDKKKQGWHDKLNNTFVVDQEFEKNV